MISGLRLLIFATVVAFSWNASNLVFAMAPICVQGEDGEDGHHGRNGDPASDGADGEDGGDGELSGGNGGGGGSGGDGVDSNGDGIATGGNGGDGGKGGNANANIDGEFQTSDLEFQRSVQAGNGGHGGLAGKSIGEPDAVALGNGGRGGNANLDSHISNDGGEAHVELNVIGGNGGNARRYNLDDSGNGGDGGFAFGASTLNVTGNEFPHSLLLEVSGGDGGQGVGTNGMAGRASSANGNATIFSDSTFARATLEARGGYGGSTSGSYFNAGNGGSVSLENAVGGGANGKLSLSQIALAGDGGSAFGDGQGGSGRGGHASSVFVSNDVNKQGDDVQLFIKAVGGNGGSKMSNPNRLSNSGGSAFAQVDAQDVGDIEIVVQVQGGVGGSQSLGAGRGGTAKLGGIYGASSGGNLSINASVIGGRGGNNNLDRAGDGASVYLNNQIDGDALDTLSLAQHAIGGASGNSIDGLYGHSGSAVSILNVEKSVDELVVVTTAEGADGIHGNLVHDGDGGNAFTRTLAKNVTGNVSVEANSKGGIGAFEGLSKAVSRAIASGSNSVAEAKSVARGKNQYSGSLKGGDAFANSVAFQHNNGAAHAESIAYGGGGIVGGNAEANATATALVGGDAVASATAAGGSATGKTFAQASGSASSQLETVAGNGLDGTHESDAGDGWSLNLSNRATGAAGDKLKIKHSGVAGHGGDGLGGRAGNGGNMTLRYDPEQINVKDGATFLTLQALAGSGGEHERHEKGGNGGQAAVFVELSEDGDLVFEGGRTTGGRGGLTHGAGDGGKGGNSLALIQMHSTNGGDVRVRSNAEGGYGGNTQGTGDAGDGGTSRVEISAESNGGDVFAVGASKSGQRGLALGTRGLSGKHGNSTSRVVANSTGGHVRAQAYGIADHFEADSQVASGGLGRAYAVAKTSDGGGGAVSAEAHGRNGFAYAEISTSNSVYRNIHIRSRANVAGEVQSAGDVQIGGSLFSSQSSANRYLRHKESSAWLVAAADLEAIEHHLVGNSAILDQFEVDQDSGEDLSDVFFIGGVGGGYSKVGTGLTTTNFVEINFDVEVSEMNDKDLVLGLFGAEAKLDGFDDLSLIFEVDGFDPIREQFTELSDATNFFSDNAINFGSLAGTDTLNGRLRLNYTSNDNDNSFQFNWVLGNAGDFGPQSYSLSAVPEPTGALAIIGLLGIALMRRKRV